MSNSFLHRILATDNGSAALALRIPVGIIFAAHGAQKLFGWFGGYGLEGTGQFFGSVGLSPGYLMALLAGAAEFFGGLALIVGLLVRPAAAALAFAAMTAAAGDFFEKNGVALRGYDPVAYFTVGQPTRSSRGAWSAAQTIARAATSGW